ncbi:MAG TPA: hypothetical protein DCQ76_05180 [Ruminococcaceae bacterium]|nr:hypothetical protein [Oscillospiraceae bacterium]
MTKNGLKRVLSLLLSVIFVFCASFLPASAADSKEELENKIAAAEAKKKQNEQKIKDLQNKIDSAKESNGYSSDQIDALQDQLDTYQSQITELNEQIDDKNAVINDYQKEIDSLQKNIDEASESIETQTKTVNDTYDLLKERRRAAYMAGENSTLEVLLTASDYESFLTRLELLSKTTKHDRQLMKSLQDDIAKLNDTKELLSSNQQEVKAKQTAVESEKADIVSSKLQVQSLYNTVDSKQSTLEKQVAQRNAYISSLSAGSKELENENKKIQAEKDRYDKKLAEIAKNASQGSGELPKPGDNTGGNTGGYTVSPKGMICPLQYSNVTISAGWHGYPGHKGIDFITRGATGNTYGKEIRAAADGKVLSAEYHSSWGNNVFIDHGNGVCTRYAHCSVLKVSKGQTVKQGQVIALVGNTGNVSPAPTPANPHAGAHLHFEVWINGTRVNPAPYLP